MPDDDYVVYCFGDWFTVQASHVLSLSTSQGCVAEDVDTGVDYARRCYASRGGDTRQGGPAY